MRDCYWGLYNKGKIRCEHLACNGHCYKEENLVATESTRSSACFWSEYRTQEEVDRFRKYKLKPKKEDPVHYWIKLTFGMLQCSDCFWDFPGSVKEKSRCPHCGVEMKGIVV